MSQSKATVADEVKFSGIGIHSGRKVDLSLKPSSSGKIVFCLEHRDHATLHPDPQHVEALYSSILGEGENKVHTVEHLMATLFALGVDSVDVVLNGDEIPIMDGSALPFANAIQKCGIRPLNREKRSMKILKSFTIQEKDFTVSVEPDDLFRISYTIDYDHPAIGAQFLELVVNKDSFVTEIAPARTFGFFKDVADLREQGLSQGGSLENALVLDEEKIINGPLRYEDEFVRHKILDFIGDLSLLGYPLRGNFCAHKAGHYAHLKAVQFLLDNPACYCLQ
ncbi:UDP-3-O-acyl-N-acetylglucosamine deacetylase [Acidobacteriota bacterium]